MKKLWMLVLTFLPLFIKAQVITTIAGNGNGGDGTPAITAKVFDPSGMVMDKYGNLYFATNLGNSVRKIDTAGIITTIAGTTIGGFSGDNGLAIAAQLKQPQELALDTAGNIYIADAANNRIRKITIATGIITTVAGNGIAAFSGDDGPATSASLNDPFSICFDASGNLYIADQSARIRKINNAGTITTIAGTGVFGSDGDGGLAINAKVGAASIRFDGQGNLYAGEANLYRIRKINTAGVISTIAGDGTSYVYNGDGIPATQAKIFPSFLAFDPSGALYISDQPNNRIRMIGSDGIIHTAAGNGVAAYAGDNGPATSASINGIGGLVFDSCGNFYLAQFNTPRIRKVTFVDPCFPTSVNEVSAENNISIYPNPAHDAITITCSKTIKDIAVINVIGQTVIRENAKNNKTLVNIASLSSGVYFVKVYDKNGGTIAKRFIKE